MDTVQQVEAQLVMRHYDGFMKNSRVRGRRGLMGRKIVILLGNPGAGKGTQSRSIMRPIRHPADLDGRYAARCDCPSDFFRQEAKGKMDAGELVQRRIVNGIVAERIRSEDCAKGIHSRRLSANRVDRRKRFNDEIKAGRSVVCHRDRCAIRRIFEENRLVGRLMCPGCGDIYNIYSRVPVSRQWFATAAAANWFIVRTIAKI